MRSSPLLIQIRSSRKWTFPWSLYRTISDRLSADVMPRSLDMTVTCGSGVVPMSTQPPAVTPVPATVTSREVDVRPGPSRVRPVPWLGPASTSVGERVPAVVLSFTLRSVPTILVPMGDGVPAVPSSVPPDCPTPVFFVDVVRPVGHSFFSDVSLGGAVPLSPNHIQGGCSQDVPEEGSLFHVSPGFLTRPSRDAPQFPPEGVLLPSAMDDFSDSELGAPIMYAQCELIPGSVTPMSLPVFLCRLDSLLGRTNLRFRLCWLWGPPLIRTGDHLPSLLPWIWRTARCWRQAYRVVRFNLRRTADIRSRMGIRP